MSTFSSILSLDKYTLYIFKYNRSKFNIHKVSSDATSLHVISYSHRNRFIHGRANLVHGSKNHYRLPIE